MNEEQERRLMAAIWPTRTEALIRSTAMLCYRIVGVDQHDPPGTTYGPIGWVGDHLHELATRMSSSRAARGKHLVGRRK